jgi:hydrogenase maturation factor HypF (carbamoyltransferase family)
MIKYLRCHECKEDVITEIEQEYSATTVPCKGCGRIKLWWYFIDLTDQEWAKEKIRQWTAKNKPPKKSKK